MTTDLSVARRGLYPDGARASSIAAFALSSLTVGRLTLDLGARYNSYWVSAANDIFDHVEVKPSAGVGSAAMAFAVTEDLRVHGSISQAFRAPNIDDLSTLGVFDFGVEVPAGRLTPERGLGYEAGVKARRASLTGSFSAYRIDLRDLIDRVRGRFEGSESLDGQRVFTRANIGAAYITGVEAELEWQAAPQITVFSNAARTYGQQTTQAQPVRRIPSFNGLVGVRWDSRLGLSSELALRFAAKQDRLASGDLDDHRIAPGGTPGWQG